jgi:phosphoglycerate dehydrogenase-like enzyme
MSGLKIAILDDYQDVALSLADWSSLNADVEVFTAPFADAEEGVKRLADFDVLVAMRERTRFPADMLSRLRSLKLLVSPCARPVRVGRPASPPASRSC